MKAPIPYFGGKAAIAPLVWDALGDCGHYIEPFCGSAAVLLARPLHHIRKIETVNDADGLVANMWRALQSAPDEVAKICDWPVNHVELNCKRRVLIAKMKTLKAKLTAAPEYFDARLAGYYIWASCCWIGSGLTHLNAIPHVSHGGMGVHALGKIPHVSHGGKGVHALGNIPHVSHGGKGVHALGNIPHVGTGGETKDVREPYNTNIYKWFRNLSARLRYVRVVCGDWSLVCGGDWQDSLGVCGIFMDPPYSHDIGRDNDIYEHESTDVAREAAAWCIERGKSKSYRIVFAGYNDEHPALLAAGWRMQKWKACGGYASQAGPEDEGRENMNRHREALFFSPHCCAENDLFAAVVGTTTIRA